MMVQQRNNMYVNTTQHIYIRRSICVESEILKWSENDFNTFTVTTTMSIIDRFYREIAIEFDWNAISQIYGVCNSIESYMKQWDSTVHNTVETQH